MDLHIPVVASARDATNRYLRYDGSPMILSTRIPSQLFKELHNVVFGIFDANLLSTLPFDDVIELILAETLTEAEPDIPLSSEGRPIGAREEDAFWDIPRSGIVEPDIAEHVIEYVAKLQKHGTTEHEIELPVTRGHVPCREGLQSLLQRLDAALFVGDIPATYVKAFVRTHLEAIGIPIEVAATKLTFDRFDGNVTGFEEDSVATGMMAKRAIGKTIYGGLPPNVQLTIGTFGTHRDMMDLLGQAVLLLPPNVFEEKELQDYLRSVWPKPMAIIVDDTFDQATYLIEAAREQQMLKRTNGN